MSFLEVADLSIDYEVGGVWRPMVEGASLAMERGDTLGLVGESGCGKTTLARGMIRLLAKNGRVREGRVTFDGQDLLHMPNKELRAVRWDRISMIFQGAMNVLDPVFTIGRQIVEAIVVHRDHVSRREAWQMAEQMLESVGIDSERARSFPHELSGGMKQRVGIAMAMALSPELVIADEPTTALDVVSQDNVLGQLTTLQRDRGFLLIVVSHDMGVIAETCDRVAVMYAGRIVELGGVRDIFKRPTHPYALGLISAIPRIGDTGRAVSIPGYPPASGSLPGCQFESRCPFREALCTQPPLWVDVAPGHGELCHFPERAELFADRARDPAAWEAVGERLADARAT